MTHAIDTLRDSVGTAIRDRLGAQVLDVFVSRDEFDDDDVLMVTVIIDDAGAVMDEDDLFGLVRHLRPRLAADGEMAFPIITFSTDREHKDTA